MKDNFNEKNPKYIGIVNLLEEMCRKCLLGKDPYVKNNIIIYRKGVESEDGNIVDGWFSQSIFSAAQEMLQNKDSFDCLCTALRSKGFTPVFTKNGEFKELSRKEKGIDQYESGY